MSARRAPRSTTSSGNVFADLQLPEPEEALAKAELAASIARTVRARKLTQAEAARTLGIDQPKVSALLRGKLTAFSTERLLRFLRALGSDVQIVVKPRARGRGHLVVIAA